jgi:DNA-binding NarL/FixJ family response regulator
METIVVIDDHAPFRGDLRALLEAEGFEVLAEAATGWAGIDAALALAPDVVIVDIGLPDIDGFGVAHELRARGSRARVLLTSSRDRGSYEKRLADTGLVFVAKDELGADAIERVLPQ